jgi:hypothetical protein
VLLRARAEGAAKLILNDITPADEIPEVRHSRASGNPAKHWIPDQVRHDGVGYLVVWLIYRFIDELCFLLTKEAVLGMDDLPFLPWN